MSFLVEIDDASITVRLKGWDRAMNGRRAVEFARGDVAAVDVVDRANLEAAITHRALGCGTHNGAKRPGGRRIGTMLGHGFGGKQFWAVPSTTGGSPLLVINMNDGEFQRAVLFVDNPERVAAALKRTLESG
jgi:hypothetical protein